MEQEIEETSRTYDMEAATGNGAPGWVKPAAGAALGGGTIILLVRRRRAKKRREEEARRKAEMAAKRAASVARRTAATVVARTAPVAAVVAEKAGPVARRTSDRISSGIDRISEDRKAQAWTLVGFGTAWILFRLSELRQLRRLNRGLAVAR
jgi:hypothetical protein